MTNIIINPFFLIFLTIITGILIGKIPLGKFKLGPSGALFTGLLISYFIINYFHTKDIIDMQTYIKNGLISSDFFNFSLILFISSVGIIASKSIGNVIKVYGFKFVFLGFLMTFTGYIVTLTFRIFFDIDKFIFTGSYSGALTSSPGLASALESAPNSISESLIGYGYALGYVPGVIVVVFSMYLIPIIFKIDIRKEADEIINEDDKLLEYKSNDFLAYSIIIFLGIVLGNVEINLFNIISGLRLGLTGGVLISSLLLGYIGKIGFLDFRINIQALNFLKTFGLLLFLSSVGLRNGYNFFSSLNLNSLLIIILSFITAFLSLFIGFFVGKFIFKINWILLSGALCGGMTSTPGLAAALDSTDNDETITGYGATYPFALIGMVIFTILLNKI